MENKLVLNQSSLKWYVQCERSFAWQRIQNLTPRGRAAALEIGTAVHAGLAVLHASNGSKQAAIQAAIESLNRTVTTAEGKTAKIQLVGSTIEECESTCIRLIEGYVTFWGDKTQLWKPIGQEVRFQVEMGKGTGIYAVGKVDNLSVLEGGLWLVDYKTASKMDPRNVMKYEMDMQLSTYIYGVSKQLTANSKAEGGPEVSVQGAIVDFLVKTKIPQYAREAFTRTEAELKEFEEEFVEYGRRILQQKQRVARGENWKIVFPKNTEHCFYYSTCAFRDLCHKDTEVRRMAFEQRDPDYVDDAQATFDKEKEECTSS